jgi:hypothetical protein
MSQLLLLLLVVVVLLRERDLSFRRLFVVVPVLSRVGGGPDVDVVDSDEVQLVAIQSVTSSVSTGGNRDAETEAYIHEHDDDDVIDPLLPVLLVVVETLLPSVRPTMTFISSIRDGDTVGSLTSPDDTMIDLRINRSRRSLCVLLLLCVYVVLTVRSHSS